ncbi:MAG: 30S ribosomal protein S9 [Candidatus Woesearchaeota archaeon]
MNIHTSGKRKSAVARATLSKGTGKVSINGQMLEFLKPEVAKLKIQEPLILAGQVAQRVDISVKINGGGMMGQADAARLAIAKALAEHDEKLKSVFLDYDRQLLVADIRRHEANKPNKSAPRDKRQKSYR